MERVDTAMLADRLFTHARAVTHAYVLLDTSTSLELEGLEDRPDGTWAHLQHRDFARQRQRAPLLVQLENAHDPLLAASLELACRQTARAGGVRQVGAWLFGDVALEDLCRRLSARMEVADGAERRRLRFHDPRVQACLSQMLDAAHTARLRGGLHNWLYLDEGRYLHEFGTPTTPSPLPASSQLPASTWSRVQRIESINLTIACCRQMGRPYRTAWIIDAERHLVRAAEQGISLPADQIAFAAHGICVHAHFDAHPRMRDAIARARRDNRGFREAVTTFDEHELQAIAADMNEHSHRKGLRTP